MPRLTEAHPKLAGFPLEFNEGWDQVVFDLARELDGIVPGWEPLQIKEKFGGLRFYWRDGSDDDGLDDDTMDEAGDAIERAERRSKETCEMCGKVGRLRGRSWVKTLCDEHGDEFEGGGD